MGKGKSNVDPNPKETSMTRKLFARFAVALLALTSIVGTAAAQFPTPPISTPSGMLLGIYAFPNQYGLRVTGTIPGYSAEGRLMPNDVIMGVSDGTNIYRIRQISDMEYAKDRIGPFQTAAIEFHRPYQGKMYAWVEFKPIGGTGPGGTPVAACEIRTEQERPGARAFYNGAGNGNGGLPTAAPVPLSPSQTTPPATNDPASFFNR
jgi:hypothetical protein